MEENNKTTTDIGFVEKIIEYFPYSMMIMNKDGNLIKVNKAFVNLFKTPPPPDYNFFRDPTLGKYDLNKMVNKLKEGESIYLEPIWFNPKKNINSKLPDVDIYLGVLSFAILDKKKNIIYFISIHNDLTRQKRSEDALQEKIEELEKLNRLMVGRELKMIELKEENAALKNKLKQKK